MKKLLLVLMVIIVSNSFAGLGWYQDYVIVKVNNVLVNTTGYMWIGSNPSYGTEFNGYNLGSSVNSIILGCDMKYWSDNQDRTGGAFYYMVKSSDNSTIIIGATEVIWTQAYLGGNDYQGTHLVNVEVINTSVLQPNTTYNLHVWAKSWGSSQGDSYLNNSGNNYVATFTTDGNVPVQLSSFTAAIQNKSVVLNWATATEINNYGFEVERSFDKVNWNKIGFKNGYGNSNSVKDYSYIDNDITKNGMYYYRLKQIDNNGNYEYSNVIEVNVNIPVKFEVLQNYPNPFNPITNISFTLPEATNVTLYIFNAIGQQIKAVNAGYRESGKHTIEFDGSDLNSGIYFYKVEAGKNSTIRKMALIK